MDPNRPIPAPPRDHQILLLGALAWAVADGARAARLIDVTGIDPAALRARADDPVVLGAVADFLADHEPDLLACADAIGCAPSDIVAARRAVATMGAGH